MKPETVRCRHCGALMAGAPEIAQALATCLPCARRLCDDAAGRRLYEGVVRSTPEEERLAKAMRERRGFRRVARDFRESMPVPEWAIAALLAFVVGWLAGQLGEWLVRQ